MLCGIMNLPGPVEKDQVYLKALGAAIKEVAEETMTEAIEKAVIENSVVTGSNERKILAGFDGSWQKRGHQSKKKGVVKATSVETGKVLDVSSLSKFCCCLDKSNHDASCAANYMGSSGGMEVAGALEIFNRSLEKHNVMYDTYLGDGDSKGYKAV